VSERRACQVLNHCRATQRYVPQRPDDEERLRIRIIELARAYGRYGYRRITALLHWEGWAVNHKRVERIWREEGLKVPKKQPKRARLWLTDGSCIRKRPEYPHHVWSYDFLMDRTVEGRPLKLLVVMGVVAQLAPDEGCRYNGSWHTTHTPTDTVFVTGVLTIRL
jgi:putative transposase